MRQPTTMHRRAKTFGKRVKVAGVAGLAVLAMNCATAERIFQPRLSPDKKAALNIINGKGDVKTQQERLLFLRELSRRAGPDRQLSLKQLEEIVNDINSLIRKRRAGKKITILLPEKSAKLISSAVKKLNEISPRLTPEEWGFFIEKLEEYMEPDGSISPPVFNAFLEFMLMNFREKRQKVPEKEKEEFKRRQHEWKKLGRPPIPT